MTILLSAGVLGTTLFVLVFLIDGATRSGYHPVRQPVSALALGPRGWGQTTNFIVSGLLTAASAAGVQLATDSWWLAIPVGVFGTALVASGALLLYFGTAWEADHPRAGLIQRLAIVVGWSWLGLTCWRLIVLG